MRRSQGYFGFSSFGENGDNLKGTLESGEFGFYNDFTVRFDNVDYDQVAKMTKDCSCFSCLIYR